jgi:hypothetical protein
MKIYFECTCCKEVEPIDIVALSANGFGLQCSVCKTHFTFGVVAVEHPRVPPAELTAADYESTAEANS